MKILVLVSKVHVLRKSLLIICHVVGGERGIPTIAFYNHLGVKIEIKIDIGTDLL